MNNLSRKDISLRLYIVVDGASSQGIGRGWVEGVFFTRKEAEERRLNALENGRSRAETEIWDCIEGVWKEKVEGAILD